MGGGWLGLPAGNLQSETVLSGEMVSGGAGGQGWRGAA